MFTRYILRPVYFASGLCIAKFALDDSPFFLPSLFAIVVGLALADIAGVLA